MIERVLSLDISTKTGWALLVSGPAEYTLEAWGQIKAIHEPKDSPYPQNYVDWAYLCFAEIVKLIDQHTPDILVIEETAGGSKSVYSQKILEYIHFLLARLIRDTGIRASYLMTEQWRRLCDCLMTKEEKKRNSAVTKYKKTTGEKLARNAEGKVMGRISRKHVNIRRANELFGAYFDEPLRKKDEDTADALLLAYAHHGKKVKESI